MISSIRLKFLHRDIDRLLKEEIAANPVTYNGNGALPYQAYGRIGLAGVRSVEQRLAEYGIQEFISSQATVLDIGSNTGFFVVELALIARMVHGVEPNSHLNEIGSRVARYLGVSKKVAFFDCTFEAFRAVEKYDVIMSLAAFHTADGRERSASQAYFGKIRSLLRQGGKLVYESTGYSKEDDPANSFGTSSRQAMEAAAREIRERFVVLREEEVPAPNAPSAFRKLIVAVHSKPDAGS